MSTHVSIPQACNLHDPLPGHPESPARITAIDQILRLAEISELHLIRDEHRFAQALAGHP